MVYLVTGGTGFIGSYLVRDLLAEGNDVVTLQRSSATPLLKELIPFEKMQHLVFIQGTIADNGLLNETIKKYHPEIIVHFGWSMIPECDNDISLALQTNVIGTHNVFKAALFFKLKRVVWSASNTAINNLGKYFNNNLIDDSRGLYCPPNFYAATKALGEIMARQYTQNHDIDIITLRFPRVYGPGKNSGGGAAFTNLIKEFALNNPITIQGGDSSQAYLYVEDSALVTLKACNVSSTKNKLFNPHVGRNYNGWELAEILEEINPQAKITVLPGKIPYDMPETDTSPCRIELGFIPQYSLKEGIRKFANYFRKKNNLSLF